MSGPAPLDAEAIADALYIAAGSGDPSLQAGSCGPGQLRATSADRRVAAVRRTVLRFLEACPEEASVLEVREAIEGIGSET